MVRIDVVELQNIVKLRVFQVNLLVAGRERLSSNEHNVKSLLVLDQSCFVANIHTERRLARTTEHQSEESEIRKMAQIRSLKNGIPISIGNCGV